MRGQEKVHYKLYKSRKMWVCAAVVSGMVIFTQAPVVKAATTSQQESVTEINTTVENTNSVVSQSSVGTQNEINDSVENTDNGSSVENTDSTSSITNENSTENTEPSDINQSITTNQQETTTTEGSTPNNVAQADTDQNEPVTTIPKSFAMVDATATETNSLNSGNPASRSVVAVSTDDGADAVKTTTSDETNADMQTILEATRYSHNVVKGSDKGEGYSTDFFLPQVVGNSRSITANGQTYDLSGSVQAITTDADGDLIASYLVSNSGTESNYLVKFNHSILSTLEENPNILRQSQYYDTISNSNYDIIKQQGDKLNSDVLFQKTLVDTVETFEGVDSTQNTTKLESPLTKWINLGDIQFSDNSLLSGHVQGIVYDSKNNKILAIEPGTDSSATVLDEIDPATLKVTQSIAFNLQSYSGATINVSTMTVDNTGNIYFVAGPGNVGLNDTYTGDAQSIQNVYIVYQAQVNADNTLTVNQLPLAINGVFGDTDLQGIGYDNSTDTFYIVGNSATLSFNLSTFLTANATLSNNTTYGRVVTDENGDQQIAEPDRPYNSDIDMSENGLGVKVDQFAGNLEFENVTFVNGKQYILTMGPTQLLTQTDSTTTEDYTPSLTIKTDSPSKGEFLNTVNGSKLTKQTVTNRVNGETTVTYPEGSTETIPASEVAQLTGYTSYVDGIAATSIAAQTYQYGDAVKTVVVTYQAKAAQETTDSYTGPLSIK